MNDNSTDKILVVALTIVVMATAMVTGEQRLYDGFLIALGVAINKIGSRVEAKG